MLGAAPLPSRWWRDQRPPLPTAAAGQGGAAAPSPLREQHMEEVEEPEEARQELGGAGRGHPGERAPRRGHPGEDMKW